MPEFTESEIYLLNVAVHGTFSHFENEGEIGVRVKDGPIMVFSSHTFPSHRITVLREKAIRYLEDVLGVQQDGPYSE